MRGKLRENMKKIVAVAFVKCFWILFLFSRAKLFDFKGNLSSTAEGLVYLCNKYNSHCLPVLNKRNSSQKN